jgi:FKBP-type peptidyl-prolyl cis-trans isomerase FkpA
MTAVEEGLRSSARGNAARRAAAVITSILVLGGCRDATEQPMTGQPHEVAYAPDLNVDLAAMQREPSGLYTRDLVAGAGEEATPGRWVTVHYTGSFPNGRQFDSSRGQDPLQFLLGAGEVIQGWEEGVAGMRVGGRRQLVIPPDLGYGDAGAGGVIPPNATLVFEVELLELE